MKGVFIAILLLLSGYLTLHAQEAFYIKDFDVDVKVNKDASLQITEKLSLYFTQSRHGIIRYIPFRYKISKLPAGMERADMSWSSGDYRYIRITDVNVKGAKFKTSTTGDFETIKIGSENILISGDQNYEISYKIEGAINFFRQYSELYLNLTGNNWATEIQEVHFTIHFPAPVPDTARWFVATGRLGSQENNTATKWNTDRTTLQGMSIAPLKNYEGITVGVSMPSGFLTKLNYNRREIPWLLLPLVTFFGMFAVWRRWGKDPEVTVVPSYYPPEEMSPPMAGYLIDGSIDRRDLTALIPYWGAKGYLKVEESERKVLLGLLKNFDYKFIKLKNLDPGAEKFEHTMFDGLFRSGNEVDLSDLENTFYITMASTKDDLEKEMDTRKYYVQYSRGFAVLFAVFGVIILILSLIKFAGLYPLGTYKWGACILASLIVIIFGSLMSKKSEKGTEVYQQLLGFKEFIKSVEQDKLNSFLKEDPNYFDKVLPYAIVFNLADKWKDKLKGLDVPPPSWFTSSSMSGANFSNLMFLNGLNRSMNSMSHTFYSQPSSSGSSGGSFGGGGSSGGGFGGGGGSSW